MNVRSLKSNFNVMFSNILYSFVIVVATLISPDVLAQSERIIDLNSNIIIHRNGSMRVHETILYENTNRTDLHGIVREFPTQYRSRSNTVYNVKFAIKQITRDGEPVSFHVKTGLNGKRIFIGNSKITISPGVYRYDILYETDRQLGFFEKHDELYWNVTGNGWPFYIDHAMARVVLPSNVPLNRIKMAAYTGKKGLKGTHYKVKIEKGAVIFETTQALAPYQGLTIVVGWPKGFIDEPTWQQNLNYFFSDNIFLLFLIFGLLALLFYCIVVYRSLNRLIPPGIVIPRFKPPRDLLPGVMRYIQNMKYDEQVFAASLVDMAVKGNIVIEYTKGMFGSHNYVIKKKEKAKETAYKNIMSRLFKQGNSLNIRKKKNAQGILRASNALRSDCTLASNGLFALTTTYLVGAVWIVLVTLALAVVFEETIEWSLWHFVAIFLSIFIILLFRFVLRMYTKKGRAIKDEIEGFKMFLEVTETEQLKIIGTPPTKTPQLYERYLPYAIALGIEEAWTKQFASIFNRLIQEGTPYVPVWYIGTVPFRASVINRFSSNLASTLQSSISSASSPPGSSSGFGGGGSSGGGAGGGGGGSW